ncbi:MAG: alpha/beta fold hydrolase [Leptolyngbya sp. IPPAS B-1204]|nr:alpha/beta hydrolase [Elainella sp. C42_A2020_010]RNJ67096.1 MAG: alpha/beta hydrolase [Leptolyngbya sp. IPPAS B-1204]
MKTTSTDWWQQTFPSGRKTLTIQDASQRQVTLAYGEAGVGQPLFLLHGLGSWSYNWRHNVHPLSQYFRVICFDAKGYGFSQTASPPEVIGHQVIELVRVINALAEPPVTLVAESLGALVALAVAQSYPQLIERLVLINVPIFPQKLPSWGMEIIAAVPLPLIEWLDQQQLIRPFQPIVQWMTQLVRQEVVYDPTSINDEEIHWLTYPYLNFPGTFTQFAIDLQLAAQEIERCQQGRPNWISTIQQNLANVTCPVLILWSDCDRWFPLQDGEKLRDQIPSAQFQVIPNCGHVASSGNPAVVNAAILQFLKSA